MAFGRKIIVNGLPYARRVCMTRFFVFLRTTLRHFEGDKNQLAELYNNTSIVAQGEILGPGKNFLNLIQQNYPRFC